MSSSKKDLRNDDDEPIGDSSGNDTGETNAESSVDTNAEATADSTTSQTSNSAEPTTEQVVEQIQQISESQEGQSGPNLTLRSHIEKYSRYSPLFASLAYAIIGAIFLPVILLFLFIQLSPAFELDTLPGAIQRGLGSIILPLFVALALSRSVVSKGLANRHLNWSDRLCEGLSLALNSIIFVVLPMRFLYVGLETFGKGIWNDSLGRLAFMVAMIGFASGMLLAVGRLRKWMVELRPEREWFDHLFIFLLYSLPLLPAGLAIMAAVGFYFTAEELSGRTVRTVLLMVSIALAGGIFSRILLIAQFGIKLRELQRDEDGQISSEESIDIQAISAQVNRLIRATALVAMVMVGWQIWSNVLPALNYLDQVQLWEAYTFIDGKQAAIPSAITLRHLLIATGMLTITYILSSNLPGLLEITLLDRLPLDRGGRYAISFVVRYLVGIIGILAACQLLGFSWNRVQWLAAGLTVGLGFGLQEIFANLISGIIILIERPIRVGDLVTVNNTTGTVTKMALRATTIMDFDYREMIVPNKKFITEDVMNWTLSDNKSRLIIKVGVAYGSDTTLVQNTLLKVARRYPLITREPEPQVVFTGFGDNSLNFELRVVTPTRDLHVKVTHELHMAVDEAFRQKNIDIAFPQRDIRIKNLGDFFPLNPNNGPQGRGGTAAGATGSNQPANRTSPGPRASVEDDDEDYAIRRKRAS